MKSRTVNFRFAAPAFASAIALVIATGEAAAQAILTDQSPQRQEKLIAGAKKEGKVTIYSAMIVNQALRPLVTGFMKKYPFIKATYWRAASENIIAKVSAEVRANNLVADVVEGTGIGELAGQGNLVVPYHTPMLKDYPEKLRDKEGLWTPTRLSYFSIAYNTKQVAKDQVPKTYDDLLKPQWNGKMAWRIGTSSGTPLFIANLRLARGEDKAMDYFKKLKDQKIVNFGAGSARTLVDRVIAGEFAIALNIFAHHPLISKGKGAPVDSALLDPVPATSATMVIPRGLKNPHAALLLIDFVLSKEGQEILAKANYFPARPDVEPKKNLWPVVPAKAGVPENFVTPENMLKYTDTSNDIYNKMFR